MAGFDQHSRYIIIVAWGGDLYPLSTYSLFHSLWKQLILMEGNTSYFKQTLKPSRVCDKDPWVGMLLDMEIFQFHSFFAFLHFKFLWKLKVV